MYKRFFSLVLSFFMLYTLVGCDKKAPNYFILGITEIDLIGGNSKAAEREITDFLYELESQIATDNNGSDVYKFNAAKSGEKIAVREYTKDLTLQSKALYIETEGAFNPCLFPLSELWGFSPEFEGKYHVSRPSPTQDELENYRALIDFDKITLSGESIVKEADGMKLDFGAIAKGYAADKAFEIAKKHGVTGGKIDIGGNLYMIGEKDGGLPYKIGVKNPRSSGDPYAFKIEVKNTSVATSGDYERYYSYDGARYCHILSGDTLSPIASGVMSVTIINESSMLCDVYATVAMVLGHTDAVKFLSARDIDSIIIFENADGKFYDVAGSVGIYFDSGAYTKWEA